ncbi:pilus assembly protein TadE [Acidovorax sp. SRB_14]|uniref:TadE family protein n=1 Tax=Acidovorax sp. SRB_14 TaxID=1962699 RepID=UPI00156485FD|nr:TadE family protein [Acidovorax sp. SRB_14]NMM79514.1 pilus assembly protein TadE [Acidovorax sp. SRB_14]
MKNKEHGVAIIEFALILPLLLILTFIATEFGRAIYQYNTITKSVRDAARYLSMQDPTIKVNDLGKITIARNLVVYGNPNPGIGDLPLAIGLKLENVPAANIQWNIKGANPSINVVTISVTGYKFKSLISNAFGVVFGDSKGDISFGEISATMRAQS